MSICRPGRVAAGLEPDREAERVDAVTEALFTERRRERFAKRARGFAGERREQRAGMDPFSKHREILRRAATISTAAAGSTERSRGGSESPSGPPRQQQLDDDPRWREHWDVIDSRFDRVLELLDELEGHGTVADNAQMTGAEKDRLVLSEGLGLSPAGVVAKLGSHIAGSPRTVERIRETAGRSKRDGNRLEAA